MTDRLTITIRPIKPKPLLSLRKVGGMYHWRIGPIGGSFYRTSKGNTCRTVNPVPVIAAAMVLAVAAIACLPTYDGLQLVTEYVDGSSTIDDTGLTVSDCAQRIAAAPYGVTTYCEVAR